MPRSKKKKTYNPGDDRPAGMQLDGRYRGKRKVGVDADGMPVYKYASGRTKGERDAALDEIEKSYIWGTNEVNREVLLEVYAWQWYDTYKKPMIASANALTYKQILSKHICQAFANRQMRSIMPIELQQFLNDRAGYKDSYMKKIFMILRALFKRATFDGVIDRDPSVMLVKPTKPDDDEDDNELLHRALTAEERKTVLGTVLSEPNGILIMILYHQGLRPGEALGLRWEDIDWKKRTMRIRRDIDYSNTIDGEPGKLKNKQSKREVPIPKALFNMLDARKGAEASYIVRSPTTGMWLRKSEYIALWERLMKVAYRMNPNIPSKISPNCRVLRKAKPKKEELAKAIRRSSLCAYDFRHNYATALHAKKIDVLTASKWMGHKDPVTMLRFYAHLDELNEIHDASLLDEIFEMDETRVARKLPETV